MLPLSKRTSSSNKATTPNKSPSSSRMMDGSDQQQLHQHQQEEQAQHHLETCSSSSSSSSSTKSIGLTLETATTFRDDVRNEWIQAVFGENFPERSTTISKQPSKGMGLAQIAPYTAYQVQIPATTEAAAAATTTLKDDTSTEINTPPPLGISITRLALGLYVRRVQPGSEAWCAGIVPHSVLVSINGMSLLAEPSKQALERLWQYEGFLQTTRKDNADDSSQSETTKATATATATSATPSNHNNTTPSAATATATATATAIREPLRMTLIYQGRLYSVVLLSNPPYGVDWAPCGNFALVKKVSHSSPAGESGVVKGSIIASITDCSSTTDNGSVVGLPIARDISEMDHTLAAESLRTLRSNRRDIQLTLCIPPSEARSGHWERLWDTNTHHPEQGMNTTPTRNRNLNHHPTTTNTASSTTAATRAGFIPKQSTPSSSSPSPLKQVHRRPRVARQLDGVEVRVHPLLFSSPGSPRSFKNSKSTTSSTTASGMSSSLSQLAFRVAAGELFSFFSRPSSSSAHHRRSYYYSQRYYRTCPPLDQSLTELLTLDDSLVYLLHYHKANYDERKTRIMATNNNSNNNTRRIQSRRKNDDALSTLSSSRVLSFLNDQSPSEARQSMESFLLPMLALLRLQQQSTTSTTSEEKKEEEDDKKDQAVLSPLASWLLEMASNNGNGNSRNVNRQYYLDLCRRMECMAQALELKDVKEALVTARNQRIEFANSSGSSSSSTPTIRRRQPRQIPIRVEQRALEDLFLSPVANSSTATGTTASAITMSSSIVSSSSSSVLIGNPHGGVDIKASKKGIFGFFRKKKKPSWSRSKKGNKSSFQKTTTATASDTALPATNVSHGNPKATMQLINSSLPPRRRGIDDGRTTPTILEPRVSKDVLFTNTLTFLTELEAVCLEIEKTLLRSFSQKIAGWALQPWSASKETELAQVTQVMRERLRKCPTLPLLNPVDDSETLVSVDAHGSYILPSAHFPLLLTFDCQDLPGEEEEDDSLISGRSRADGSTAPIVMGRETIYRTKMELVELHGSNLKPVESSGGTKTGRRFVVHGSVGGAVSQSAPSIATNRTSDRHAWDQGNILTFDCRSSWGAPETLSLLVSQSSDSILNSDENGKLQYEKEIGYCFVDMAPLWHSVKQDETSNGGGTPEKATQSYHLKVWSCHGIHEFDEHGDLPDDSPETVVEDIEIQIKVTVQRIPLTTGGLWARKRSLLYKHDDDVRQELFAIEFIKSCDAILKSCGLDLKLLTFRCIPVAERRGFIEWVHGSVPLSEICQPFAGSILDGTKKDAPARPTSKSEEDPPSSVAKAGLTKYESLHRVNNEQVPQKKPVVNPIQQYLRAFHFDCNDPYMIRKQVMETYVKSCAGYCVITYILGVGDRHLDNLLLHSTGHFFHCDYSFILGHDPKKYLPLRITEDMVNGMGGRDSDNYAMFLSLTCAAFLTFRRPENVRHLMSFVRLMEGCCTLPSNIDSKQALETAMMGIRERLQLDLTDDEAISFMEKLIEESCSSRMWLAVDAIHSLGKRF